MCTVGNVEDWLGVVELAMKKTVKVREASLCVAHPSTATIRVWFPYFSVHCRQDLCGKVAEVCKTIELSSLLRDYTAQMAIIGVQLAWTAQVTAALDNSRTQKAIIAETAKHQLMQLAELSSWSCTDIASVMTRYATMFSLPDSLSPRFRLHALFWNSLWKRQD
jgi:hypothetical protein